MPHAIVVAENPMRESDLQEFDAPRHVELCVRSLGTPEEVFRWTRDADAVIVAQNPLTAKHIDALGPNVRVISRSGSGLDAIDLSAAERRGLTVFHTPDYCTAEVATHAVALILAVQRRVLEGDRVARMDFNAWRSVGKIRPLDEMTVGAKCHNLLNSQTSDRSRNATTS